MKPGIIYLYAGKIEEWTKDWQEEKHPESLWGRLLLIQGLQELGYDWLFPQNKDPEQLLEVLEASLGKGLYGKPYLTEYPEIHFNISHSGRWAVCALASMPCGVDIQERRPIRSRRMVERTMNAREQRQILEAEDSTGEFIKLWTYKGKLYQAVRGRPSSGHENPESACLPSILLAGKRSGWLRGCRRSFSDRNPLFKRVSFQHIKRNCIKLTCLQIDLYHSWIAANLSVNIIGLSELLMNLVFGCCDRYHFSIPEAGCK